MDSEMEAAEAEAELLFSTRQATSGVTSKLTEVWARKQGLLEPFLLSRLKIKIISITR